MLKWKSPSSKLMARKPGLKHKQMFHLPFEIKLNLEVWSVNLQRVQRLQPHEKDTHAKDAIFGIFMNFTEK